MPYPRFLAFDAAGGLIWAIEFTLLGYLAGANYQKDPLRLTSSTPTTTTHRTPLPRKGASLMSGATPIRNAPLVVTVLLLALGVVLGVVGVLYLADTADHLPSFFPGHQAGSTHHHTRHAILALGLALLAWISAWMSAGKKTPG